MEKELLEFLIHISSTGISFDIVVIMIQFFIVYYITMWLKDFFQRILAWQTFKRSKNIDINSVVSVNISQIEFTGVIKSAGRKGAIISNEKESLFVDIRKLVKEPIKVHKKNIIE